MHIRRGFLQILLNHTIVSSSKNDGVQVVIRIHGGLCSTRSNTRWMSSRKEAGGSEKVTRPVQEIRGRSSFDSMFLRKIVFGSHCKGSGYQISDLRVPRLRRCTGLLGWNLSSI